jgi:isopentenyl diphosphate isomerase/L-lactate dehydrogenase-like FMN-dependent dehydrogenase
VLAAAALPSLLERVGAQVVAPAAATRPDLIASARDALDVFDFEAVAQQKLSPAHWGYLVTGVDGEETLRANEAGFARFVLRVRRLVDVSAVDLSRSLFGTTWALPVALAPIGSHKAFHPEGELAVARAAHAKGTVFVLSTVGTASIEEVTRAMDGPGPVWFQLYPTNDWNVALALSRRAERAGCPVLVLTVDLQGGSNRLTSRRFERRDPRSCTPCHTRGVSFAENYRRRPMFEDLDLSGVRSTTPPDMTWDYITRLKNATSMKLVLKGLVTAEDARMAVERGVDGLIVSNHGGRAEESGRSAIESLPEVLDAVGGKLPVLIDGGFRRGVDVFKALALGATAVFIGRPYIWGLASFGQEGVEAVLDLLRRELQIAMRQAGTTALARITRAHIIERGR